MEYEEIHKIIKMLQDAVDDSFKEVQDRYNEFMKRYDTNNSNTLYSF
jgi:DNA replication initiation complex subunit (GINS family)